MMGKYNPSLLISEYSSWRTFNFRILIFIFCEFHFFNYPSEVWTILSLRILTSETFGIRIRRRG